MFSMYRYVYISMYRYVYISMYRYVYISMHRYVYIQYMVPFRKCIRILLLRILIAVPVFPT